MSSVWSSAGEASSPGEDDPSGAMTHLITHFRSRGITAEHLETMRPELRTHYAKQAGLNVPTEEGWEALIDKMRRHWNAPQADTVE